jgi:hypothetical protein
MRGHRYRLHGEVARGHGEGLHLSSSGGPAPLLVHVLRRSLVLAVPLLRLLIGRASYGTDGADREYEASPDEGEHPKH